MQCSEKKNLKLSTSFCPEVVEEINCKTNGGACADKNKERPPRIIA
jgi:hypothetical protein